MDGDAVTKRPGLAVLVSCVISRGAFIEVALTRLAADVLAAEKGPVAAMLQTIVNFRAKLDLVKAAIFEKFDDEMDQRVSDAVFRFVQSAMNRRNKIAHYIYAVHSDLPDDLILIEPEAYVDMITANPDYSIEHLERNLDFCRRATIPERDRMWVYTKKDFLDIDRDLRRSYLYLVILSGFLIRDGELFDWEWLRNQALTLLCKEPSIAKAAHPDRISTPTGR